MIDPNKFAPRLEKISLEVSSISFECFSWYKNVEGQKYKGGIIAFQGVYPLGSGGKDHAFYIKWRINELAERERLQGIIVDFSGLDYRWGDDLQGINITSVIRREGSICFVIQPAETNTEIYEAYKWALANQEIFTNIQKAFEAVNNSFVQNHKNRKRRKD